jgi:hypothetical protein
VLRYKWNYYTLSTEYGREIEGGDIFHADSDATWKMKIVGYTL